MPPPCCSGLPGRALECLGSVMQCWRPGPQWRCVALTHLSTLPKPVLKRLRGGNLAPALSPRLAGADPCMRPELSPAPQEMSRGCPPPGPHLALLGLLLSLNPGCAGFKGISNFFKPLTCSQLPALRKTCGGKAESFYPKQCLQQKCCHYNGTCYHHVIDGVQQRRNAGILGGSCAGAALLFLSIFIGCKLKGSQAKEKPSSEWKDRDMADFLMKLMDKSDESDEEEEEQVQKRLQETE